MTHVATVTIDSTQVPGDLTDFVIFVDLSDLGTSFWGTVANGGGDIRVFKSDGTTELPRDVISCDTGTDTGALWLKYSGTLSSSSDTEVQIHADGVSSDYGVTDTYGRNNVWSAAECALLMEDDTPVDRSGKHTMLATSGTLTTVTSPVMHGIVVNNSYSGTKLYNTDSSLINLPTGYDFSVSILSRRTGSFASNNPAVSWSGSDDLIIYTFDSAASSGTRVFWRDIGSNILSAGSQVVSGVWEWTTFTSFGSADHRSYNDGTESDTSTGTGSVGPFSDFYVGEFPGSAFNGDIGYIVVWDGARSANWTATEYNNQSDTSAFYTAAEPSAGVDVNATKASLSLTSYNTLVQADVDIVVTATKGSLSLLDYNPEVSATNPAAVIKKTVTAITLTDTNFTPASIDDFNDGEIVFVMVSSYSTGGGNFSPVNLDLQTFATGSREYLGFKTKESGDTVADYSVSKSTSDRGAITLFSFPTPKTPRVLNTTWLGPTDSDRGVNSIFRGRSGIGGSVGDTFVSVSAHRFLIDFSITGTYSSFSYSGQTLFDEQPLIDYTTDTLGVVGTNLENSSGVDFGNGDTFRFDGTGTGSGSGASQTVNVSAFFDDAPAADVIVSNLISLGFTTYQHSIKLHFNIQATKAVLSLSPSQTSVTIDRERQATKASLGFTTYPAQVAASRQVQASKANLEIVSYAAVVQADVDINVQSTKATLSLASSQSDVRIDRNREATKASLGFTTYPAQVIASNQIQATRGSLSLTSYAALIISGLEISATKASLSLTVKQPFVQTDVDAGIPVTKTSLSLASYNSTVRLDRNRAVTKASLSLVANNPLVSADKAVQATKASLSLTGLKSNVIQNKVIRPNKASITLTAYNTSTKLGVNVQVLNIGSLTLLPRAVVVTDQASGRAGFYHVVQGNDPDANTTGVGFYDDVADDPDAQTPGSGFFK